MNTKPTPTLAAVDQPRLVRHLPSSGEADCPHCKSRLLWSEDRGAHCDGCDDFNPEIDLPNVADQATDGARDQ